ncbi:hypothetical protein BCV72DRAFT_64113 [Rhizopus microsporus var. microsporus]|uniref:Uncharacterized protein n=1 Tax=Rhizopus microsporus var. microsporus TaxID=86635 RepID=A0A1X0RBN2_RHIZD|nr:hypothetical protein BCV72DRAFT_64113 [Rhizopus microsporus var. microsporus]
MYQTLQLCVKVRSCVDHKLAHMHLGVHQASFLNKWKLKQLIISAVQLIYLIWHTKTPGNLGKYINLGDCVFLGYNTLTLPLSLVFYIIIYCFHLLLLSLLLLSLLMLLLLSFLMLK